MREPILKVGDENWRGYLCDWLAWCSREEGRSLRDTLMCFSHVYTTLAITLHHHAFHGLGEYAGNGTLERLVREAVERNRRDAAIDPAPPQASAYQPGGYECDIPDDFECEADCQTPLADHDPTGDDDSTTPSRDEGKNQ